MAEAAFFRGTSSNERLFSLILRLRKLELEQQCLLHLVHVAGTRMIGQGSDGLSQGNLTEGIMTGESMMSFAPLARSSLEREPELEAWIKSWAGKHAEVLLPKDWFGYGHCIEGYDLNKLGRNVPSYKLGTFIWCPSPSAAGVVVEELRKSRHKREKACHIFMCPRLMTNVWHKLVLKEADVFFELPVGSDLWKREMCEPLLIAVCLPLIDHSPWRLTGTPKLLGVVRELRRVREEPSWDPRFILRELCELLRWLSAMSPKLVCKMLHTSSERYLPCGGS